MVESKQVRVDNWGVFFLQRLQMFFSKTDYCDLTLQFEGNVQLKVHRLVMNACTEYFMFLEQTCPALEENTIMMPSDLQSDVIVPIVNFMYTGMLEFHITIFDKLYRAAEVMNITVLTKLLEAQKVQIQSAKIAKSKPESKPKVEQKKVTQKPVFTPPELPPTMPGRKVPVWKRKTAPVAPAPTPTPTSHPNSQMNFCEEPRYSAATDPLAVDDNRPKPTRFEWPEDDLPPMDSSYEDVSLTSKPLFTKEEEEKVKHCFDDLRNNVEIPAKRYSAKAGSSGNINTKAVEDYVKEQKIRSSMFEDVDDIDIGQKRKIDQMSTSKAPPSKKLKVSNKENKESKETTISVETTDAANLDHTKIVTEILKKYPELVKKNKNIKLKIITSGSRPTPEKKVPVATIEVPKKKEPDSPVRFRNQRTFAKRKPTITEEATEDGPWTCRSCIGIGGEAQEFVLYYLYRKHMTDVHDEIFDVSLCKYCGRKCRNNNLMMYHLYTKHALKPPASYNFPKCDRCPYIAFSEGRLTQHKEKHNPNEIQCQDCKLAFTCSQTLTNHTRVTGHYNKLGRVSYDCQYCMKKLQSAINLFTHIRNTHLKEATRDGIVCLEEIDSIEQLEDTEEEEEEEEEQNSGDEYIVPESTAGSGMQKDKVKIISNVKVPPNLQSGEIVQQGKIVPLEASSEAESMNNVASGIATSLGLVDIVVLNDNQQYIIQDGQHDQTEFIIPDLSPGQPFTGQVITTQHNTVIPQGIIQTSGSDIGSTDELVMVLTDHDYPDEHEGGHQENSNIVVLYSHPVEGHEGQFITSQGNLLVNSQTGMLEIRNGTTISTSSNQMVVNNAVDSPVESIEMIQREIDGHQEMKQEPYFEEERQPATQAQQATEVVQIPENVVEEFREETVEHESCDQEVPEEQVGESQVEVGDQQEEQQDVDKSDDRVDGSMEEPMEIEEASNVTENDNREAVEETVEEQNQTEAVGTVEVEPQMQSANESEENQTDGVDVPPEQSNAQSEVSEHVIVNDPTTLSMFEQPSVEDIEEQTEFEHEEDEPMEVDGKIEESKEMEDSKDVEESMAVEEQHQPAETQEKEKNKSNEEKEQDKPTDEKEQELPDEERVDENVEAVHPEEDKEQGAEPDREEEDAVEEEEEEVEEEEEPEEPATAEVQNESSETTSKSISEDSPRQNQSHKHGSKGQLDINKTILDDWEDESDSQQSEKQAVSEEAKQSEEPETAEPISKTAAAVDNVNKLMDDWEEEEEEEKKESE